MNNDHIQAAEHAPPSEKVSAVSRKY